MRTSPSSSHRFVMGAGPPLIEERLDLALVGRGIDSLRKTAGEPNELVKLALPPEKAMDDYRQALGKTAALKDPPDEATARRIRELVRPLQKALTQAVPELARQRMVTEAAGPMRKLVAIELKLLDSQLERYPWELIADPAALSGDITDITVWRSVQSPGDRPVRVRWTSNVLLTGTAAMRRVTPFVHDELTWIKDELKDYNHLRVFPYTGIPPSFEQLLVKHRPVAFHLVAHGTSESIQFPAERGPTFKELQIHPKFIGAELEQFGVWTAVFNCCESATPPSDGNRPPAYEIAERSDATTIGMAGLIQPYTGGLFATTFYRCLARGFSVVQAFHEATCSIRDHDTFSTMWSIPVMYASTSNVVPFPIDDEARIRLSIEQIRLHAHVLDSELQTLAKENFHSSGEWAKQAATPIVRTECIGEYLAVVTTPRPATFPSERQDEINDTRDELQSALSETAESLTLLSSDRAGAQERREALSKLPLHRMRHQRILRKLDRLMGEAR